MTMEPRKALAALQALALRDLDAMSDEEINAELAESGIDPDAFASKIAEGLDDVVAASMRRHAASAKIAMHAQKTKAFAKPSLAQIKERINQAFAAEPQLATAFREGTKQSDADLESLYDDLVLMGKIAPGGSDEV